MAASVKLPPEPRNTRSPVRPFGHSHFPFAVVPHVVGGGGATKGFHNTAAKHTDPKTTMEDYQSTLRRHFSVDSFEILVDEARIHPSQNTRKPVAQRSLSRRELLSLTRWESSASLNSTSSCDGPPSLPSRSTKWVQTEGRCENLRLPRIENGVGFVAAKAIAMGLAIWTTT
jgi:hypothetical protein